MYFLKFGVYFEFKKYEIGFVGDAVGHERNLIVRF